MTREQLNDQCDTAQKACDVAHTAFGLCRDTKNVDELDQQLNLLTKLLDTLQDIHLTLKEERITIPF